MPSLSTKYAWLVGQKLEPEEDETVDHIFYGLHDQQPHYRCQIPELLRKRIRGCFHGWMILSRHPDNVIWFLWNPMTSKTIRLPPLVLKDGFESIVLLERKKKRLRWIEIPFNKQLMSLIGDDDAILHCLTYCNGKLYALTRSDRQICVIHFDIMVKDDGKVVINLSQFVERPSYHLNNGCTCTRYFLKGGCRELFYISLGFDSEETERLLNVYLFKLDMNSMIWKEIEDLKDAMLFVDLHHHCSVSYIPAIDLELAGYVHILGKEGKVIYAFNTKDKTMSLSSISYLVPTNHLSFWEYRLRGDHGEIKCSTDFKRGNKEDETVVRSVRNEMVDINIKTNEIHEEKKESHLLNIPFDVLKTIMEHCVGVEYLKFRATCKHLHLAAPMIQWSNKTTLKRWKTYSLVSPWLMVFDNHHGIITFTEPMFGDKYYIKTPEELIDTLFQVWNVDIHFVNKESSWRRYRTDFGNIIPQSFQFPTFYGQDIYTLDEGRLSVYRKMKEGLCSWENVVAKSPSCCGSSARYFLVKCDQLLLLISVEELENQLRFSS
ncbi:hypothetical protein Tco_0277767 [Tanacetum coccineum]